MAFPIDVTNRKAPCTRLTRLDLPALLIVAFGVLTTVLPASAQNTGWTAHTSFRKVRAIDGLNGQIWAATAGGVFSYDTDSGELNQLTVVDGLHSVEAAAITIDETNGLVWVGYSDGAFDRIDPVSRNVITYRDIERANRFSSRGINRIVANGDSLLIATEFGIVVFDPIRAEVRDSYTRLGDIQAATPVFDIELGADASGEIRIWAATTDGVAHAALTTINLQDPVNWSIDRSGLPPGSQQVRSLAFFQGDMYAGTQQDLYRRSDTGGFVRVFTTGAVTQLVATTDRLIGVERFKLIVVEESGAGRKVNVNGYQDPVGIFDTSDGTYWFGDAVRGLTAIPSPSAGDTNLEPLLSVIPKGPYDGLFSDLEVDLEGNLWAGGVAAPNSGFHRLDAEQQWTTFSSVFFEELSGRRQYTRIAIDLTGTGWAGSEGGGLARVTPDGSLDVFDASNSTLRGADTPTNVIVGGVDTDSQGAVWVTTRGTGTPLHVMDPQGTWMAFGPSIGDGLTASSTAYDRIYIDSFDQKWIIIQDERDWNITDGLMVLDSGSMGSQDDDLFQFFNQQGAAGQGLPSVAVTSITEDRDGLVWIGTESGPAYFVNTSVIAVDPSARAIWPQWADRSRGTFMLFLLKINDIAVDPANRLWFATEDGAWLVQAVEGGYEPVHHFTVENSPLFSNVIMSVAVDDRSGRVYFSTDRGLIAYDGDAVAPSVKVRDLFVYPNPARLSEMSSAGIFIEGMVEETEIRILTVAGSLVRRISARGGRVRWDAKDETGRFVSSGVYLVVAVGSNGEGTAHGKIAVIR